MSDILASVSVVLGAEISGFRAAMAQARRELKGLVQFSEGLKDIGTSLTQYVSLPLAALGAASVAASGKVESLKKGLEAITLQELGKQGVTGLGALQQAAQLTTERMSQLEQIAKQPGLGFEGAVQGDVRLRAVGISAEQSAKSIRAFANAIATTGGGKSEFDRVTVQLAQLSAKGKVLAQDLRPIIEAAPAVSGALQRLYGTVDSETISASLAKQGKSSTDFIAVLTDELAKLPQVSGGLKNAFENLADTATLSAAKLGDGISKALNLPGVLAGLSSFIERASTAFAGLSPGVQQLIVGLGAAAAAVGPLLVAVGTLGAALPAITAGFVTLGLATTTAAVAATETTAAIAATTTLALGPFAVAAGIAAAAGLLIYENWDRVAPLFDSIGNTLSGVASSLSSTFTPLGGLFSTVASSAGSLKLLGQVITDQLVLPLRLLAGGLDVVVGGFRLLSNLQQGDFKSALAGGRQAVDGLGLALLNIPKITGDVQKGFEGAAQGGGIFGDSLLHLSGILPGLNSQLQGFAGGLPQYGEALATQAGLLARLHEQLKQVKEDQQAAGTEKAALAFNPLIDNLEKYIARLEGSNKASKAASDAITKFRQELARLTALDNLLGDTPNQLQVLERRSDTLGKGLKTLVDAGVRTSSKAFQDFAADLVRTNQAADRLIASTGQLGAKTVSVKSLTPTTIGDTLPQDVARLLGDYAKQLKPFELPVPVKLNMQAITDAAQPVKLGDFEISKELYQGLLDIGDGYRDASAAAQVFGTRFDEGQAKANTLRVALESLIASGVSPTSQALQQLGAEYQKTALMADINTSATQALQAGIAQAVSGIAQYFGQLATGSASLNDFGKVILGLVGNIAVKLGEALIAAGVGFVALQNSLSNPYAAIAAGAALVLIGTALGSINSTLGSVGTGRAGSSGSSAPAVSNYGQNTTATVRIEFSELRLRGKDMVAFAQQKEYRNKVTG